MLFEILKYAWCIGVLALVLAGGWALVSPHSFLRLNRSTGRCIQVYCVNSSLPDKMRFIDGIIYRFHVAIGLLMILASLGIIYSFFFRLDGNLWLKIYNDASVDSDALLILSGCILAFFTVSCVLGLLVGIIILIRPNTLRPLETWGNRWVSYSQFFQHAERSMLNIDRWVEKNTRLYGAIVLFITSLMALSAS